MPPVKLDLPGGIEEILGVRVFRGLLDADAQHRLLAEIRDVIRAAPLAHYDTPWGKPMSVAMTNAGSHGWVSDRRGYRYLRTRPGTNSSWPPISPEALSIWSRVSGSQRTPQCCLVNYYARGARMGMHRDADEADMREPVVSISLGDTARFRVGGLRRRDPTRQTLLASGDVAVLAGAARRAYHGIEGIRCGESELLAEGGRLNLTLRVVTPTGI